MSCLCFNLDGYIAGILHTINTILKISLCLKLQYKIIVFSCSFNCCVHTSMFNLSSNEGITGFRFSVSCGHIVHEYAVCIVVAWKMNNSKKVY